MLLCSGWVRFVRQRRWGWTKWGSEQGEMREALKRCKVLQEDAGGCLPHGVLGRGIPVGGRRWVMVGEGLYPCRGMWAGKGPSGRQAEAAQGAAGGHGWVG